MERLGLLAALIMAGHCCAQNLVPNGSFEEYYDCPTSFGYWSEVVGWTSPFTESADYYNACAGGIVCSVPYNTAGYQTAADGQAYMGIVTYGVGYYREVIAVELTEPLQVGTPVYCSFKASPGGFGSNVNNSATWAARAPGMNFFTRLPETSQPWLFSEWPEYLFPNNSAIEVPAVLNDTSSWLDVSGVYIPDSAYSWIAIMNYYEDDQSMAEMLDNTGQTDFSYAFIDNVCISYDPMYCFNTNSIGETDRSDVRIAPNPFHDIVTIVCGSSGIYPDSVALLDLQGRTFWSGVWPKGARSSIIDTKELPAGMYILTLTYPDRIRTSKRVIRSPF